MTKSTGERLYRACVRCRSRKIKCDLYSVGEVGKVPCFKCYSDGIDCVLAGSRRGGNHARRKVTRDLSVKPVNHPFDQPAEVVLDEPINHEVTSFEARDDREWPRKRSGDSNCDSVQNPFQALRLLVQAAADASPAAESDAQDQDTVSTERQNGASRGLDGRGLESYALVANGTLDINMLEQLLDYNERYHPFMPIVPEHILSIKNIQKTAAEEPFLLTAVLTIGTKDRKEMESVHKAVWSHMQALLLRINLGASDVRNVGAVEGLLLLAEWVPHVSAGSGGRAPASILEDEEDSAAWSLVGLAVRQGYLIHLDSYFFRIDVKDEPKALTDRKRIAWTFTYMLDRQISIRMGQAFWCRGPGSSARFTLEDYPSLLPKYPYEDNFAAILQAQVEITGIFGNIHDILYASKMRTLGLMLMGDYTRYLDDSDRALAAWKDTWGKLNVSSHLRCLLDLQHEYLRLYVSAFAFQAVICRALDRTSPTSQFGLKNPNIFPHGTMATPDGRYIYTAVESSRNLLRIVNDRIDPARHLRYLPVRFYLYEIYAAVFLFKAYTLRAISKEEHQRSAALVRTFTSRLEAAATCDQHVASRYSKLLASLWFGKADAAPPQGSPQGSTPPAARRPLNTAPNGIQRKAFMVEPLPQGESLISDSFNLDVGLSWGAAGDSFSFNDSVVPLPGGYAPEGMSFPGISLPGLNGADLRSLLPFDSYQP
ncbi:hypothetical protein GQ53DRAFT_708089 [Thozetella sp. PMI_491]|nr:hypothetical protein GQ53DRAFT_708089 [Thozetella sp. PMI_491]